ncbi:MAG: hypothetical protein J4A00_01550 [Gammaproteobacteria bacterium]|nr:hypothetical protein [Gammaproteobacteria bacterium]
MAKLPDNFSDLAPFVDEWALATELERNTHRRACTQAQLQLYYDTLLPKMDAIVEHLNTFPLDDMPAPESSLLNLALMFMEVSPAIELFHQPDVPDSFEAERFEILQP